MSVVDDHESVRESLPDCFQFVHRVLRGLANAWNQPGIVAA